MIEAASGQPCITVQPNKQAEKLRQAHELRKGEGIPDVWRPAAGVEVDLDLGLRVPGRRGDEGAWR